jgi:hypothetical protein
MLGGVRDDNHHSTDKDNLEPDNSYDFPQVIYIIRKEKLLDPGCELSKGTEPARRQ